VTPEQRAIAALQEWYQRSLTKKSQFPPKGHITGALVVLDRLKNDFDLDIDSHTAPGGSQIKGAGRGGARRILESFGETRPFSHEGGRTNRGLRGGMKSLMESIRSADISRLPAKRRNEILTKLQQYLVDRVRDHHNQQRLKMIFDPSNSTWQSIHELLLAAAQTDKGGAVAQYIVGAKLQVRFPDTEVSNESYSTADVQLGRPGDFLIGDTVFHVTISPTPSHYEKCRKNLDEGLKVYLIVPTEFVAGAKQNADITAAGKISVESIESFVSQNIDELGQFSRREVRAKLRTLFEIYNSRVNACELDKSVMIELPKNLAST
jgi:hypothetical protein